MTPKHRTFLSIPWYGSAIGNALDAAWTASADMRQVSPFHHGDAFLARNFNKGWVDALNTRQRYNWTHFAMLHTDVLPWEYSWLDKLVVEMDRCGADLLSVVLPIKSPHGITSTAIEGKDGRIRRLTMKEVNDIPHKTFDAPLAGYLDGKILCSTGLWICDFTRPWVEDVWFEVRDAIIKKNVPEQKIKNHPDDPEKETVIPAHTEFDRITHPEDWHFSKLLHTKGLRVMATKALPCSHFGTHEFGNMGSWGSVEHDEWSEPIEWLRERDCSHVQLIPPYES